MRSSKVAKRYARALMGLSGDHKQLEIWGAELERLAFIIESPEIASHLESPELLAASRINALRVIEEKLDLSFPVRSFILVVAAHGRLPEIPAIAEAYASMLDDLLGRARCILTFAQPPADGDLRKIIAGLGAIVHKTVIPTINIDASLIGGVVAELEGKTYDGSLAARLADAQHRLIG
ncbi:MAG TPA: ATP synthase F1 subunit delta [Candidatus Binataceae bacterium]|nr:ATP synthase F1 subunit delta [Candidatus Binataceae bacterium]